VLEGSAVAAAPDALDADAEAEPAVVRLLDVLVPALVRVAAAVEPAACDVGALLRLGLGVGFGVGDGVTTAPHSFVG
jgi:hypothetical protein